MKKIAVSLAIFSGLILSLPLGLFGQNTQPQPDQLVITTYYPSPNGSYGNLGTNKLAVSVTGSPDGTAGQPQVAVPPEFSAMHVGDAHIGWSMIVGSRGDSTWAYDALKSIGGSDQRPGDGVVLIKNQLAVGLNTPIAAGGTTGGPRLDVQNPRGTLCEIAGKIQNLDTAANSNGLLVNIGRPSTNSDAYILNLQSPDVAAGFPQSRLYVRSDGNIGIGSTIPSARLSVMGPDNLLKSRVLDVYNSSKLIMSVADSGNVAIGVNPSTIGKFHVYSDSDTYPVGFFWNNTADGNGVNILTQASATGYALDVSNGTGSVLRVNSNGNVGIGIADPQAVLQVSGTAGNNTGVWSQISDKRLKEDIKPLEGVLGQILKLQGVSFKWKDKRRGQVLQRGFIAQDVEKVFPEWVWTDKKGYKWLEKTGIEALLVEAIREQQNEIKALQAEIKDLKSRIK